MVRTNYHERLPNFVSICDAKGAIRLARSCVALVWNGVVTLAI